MEERLALSNEALKIYGRPNSPVTLTKASALPRAPDYATGQSWREREICDCSAIAAVAKRPFDLRHEHQLPHLDIAAGKAEIVRGQPIGLRRHSLCAHSGSCIAKRQFRPDLNTHHPQHTRSARAEPKRRAVKNTVDLEGAIAHV